MNSKYRSSALQEERFATFKWAAAKPIEAGTLLQNFAFFVAYTQIIAYNDLGTKNEYAQSL